MAYCMYAVMMADRTVIHNSSTIRVTVDLHEDALFEFPCSADSDDSTPVSYRWYHVDEETEEQIAVRIIPGELTVTDNGSLIIQLAKNHAEGWGKFHGRYICRASNSYSEAVRDAVIHVKNYIPPGQSIR